MVSEDDIAYVISSSPMFQDNVKANIALIRGITKNASTWDERITYDEVIGISIYKRALELILDNDEFWNNF